MFRNNFKSLINKNNLFIFLFFVVANIGVYFVVEINKDQRIQKALDQHENKLQTHYEILLYHQKQTANASYQSTFEDPKIASIIQKAYHANEEERTLLRNQLHDLLAKKYNTLKSKGVLQYHFVFPNNTVFLRMHKPSKFGDDLTGIREDFMFVNEHKTPIHGFDQGRTAHGFRHVYPVFNDDEYVGAVEISFSSEILQEYLTEISKIHTHFLVDKHIFDVKAWNRDDLVNRYVQSSEHPDYMITMTSKHNFNICVVSNQHRLEPVFGKIDAGIKKGDPFAVYTLYKGNADIISFIPIKNTQDTKTLGWLVSYEVDDFVNMTLEGGYKIQMVALIVIALLSYFMYRILNQKEILDKLVTQKVEHIEQINRELEESEHELQLLNESLEQRVKEEIEKNNQIQKKLFHSEKMVAMGEMIGNIAHQWRQPLSMITTSVTGMKLQQSIGILDGEDLVKNCDAINEAAQYLSHTIDDFRDFIKGDKEKSKFNLTQTIKKALNIQSSSIKNHELKIITNLDDSIQIESFPNALIQSFINIFNNSKDILKLKNNRLERFIFITTYKQNDKVYLSIKDNGGGIPDEIIHKIFDAYFTTKHQSQGTGLGLHMTYNLIVQHMHGLIDVHNVEFEYEGKHYTGAEFLIIL